MDFGDFYLVTLDLAQGHAYLERVQDLEILPLKRRVKPVNLCPLIDVEFIPVWQANGVKRRRPEQSGHGDL